MRSTPRTLSSAALAACLALLAWTMPAVAAIGPAHTAHWYAPDRSGEGWMLEILSEDSALLYWFTYDEGGHQRWLMAVGDITGDSIHFDPLILTTGGRFGPGFDPDDVVRTPVGSATMSFHDCHNGQFSYEAFGQSQTFAITRLSESLGLPCDAANTQTNVARAGFGGSWFDPDRSGEGFIVQWLASGQILLIWFSFDTEGQPYWILGVGAEEHGRFRFPAMHATRGARFGNAFDPSDVERFAWGELQLQLDCQRGRADYDAIVPGFGGGQLDLSRLTRLQGVLCTPLPQPDLAAAQWQLAPGGAPPLSELPAVRHGTYAYVAGGLRNYHTNTPEFWRYAPERGWTRLPDMPQRRDHVMIAAQDGSIYVFGGLASGPASHTITQNAWRFDLTANQWHVLPDMPGRRTSGGAASMDGFIYVAGGHRDGIDRYDPVRNEWRTLPLADTAPRDHCIVLAYRGELWLIGGRSFGTDTNGSVLIYDPRTGAARAGPSLTHARAGHAGAVVGDKIIVTGGEILGIETDLVRSAEVYSPDTERWSLIANPPVSVHGGPAVAFGNRFHLLLGSGAAADIINPGTVQVLMPAD